MEPARPKARDHQGPARPAAEPAAGVAVASAAGVAVMIPCHNEASTIGKVVRDFQRALPAADVYVYDNNSTDGTGDIAREAGARVRHEPIQGKGAVVRSMFRDLQALDAGVLVMADGDDTYPAEAAPALVAPVADGRADIAIGARLNPAAAEDAFPPLHRLGNALLCALVNVTFGAGVSDLLSGYRVYSRAAAAALAVESDGFEVETELTIRAARAGLRTVSVPIEYRARPAGSESKLRTFRDGWRILSLIRRMARRPS